MHGVCNTASDEAYKQIQKQYFFEDTFCISVLDMRISAISTKKQSFFVFQILRKGDEYEK